MTFIFDHLLATIICGGLFLSLVTTQIGVSEASVEQVSAHAAKTAAISLGEWIEEDVTSLGANFGNNLMRFTEPDTNAAGETVLWEFYSDSTYSSTDVERFVTRYRLEVVDTVEVETAAGTVEPTDIYQLSRETASTPVVSGTPIAISPSDWTAAGMSVGSLSRFRIGFVKRDGQPTAAVDETDYIRVEFATVPHFETRRGYLAELYWATTLKIRPFGNATTTGLGS